MTSYWIKLYHEILRDPKMGLLDDHVWRRTIELFLIAGEIKDDGRLPAVADTAWLLRTSEQDLQEVLAKLAEIGITQQDEDGWMISNFAKRQAPLTSAERMRLHRQRKQTQSNPSAREGAKSQTTFSKRDIPVTDTLPYRDNGRYEPDNTCVPDTDTDTDIDKEADKDVESKQMSKTAPHKRSKRSKMTGAIERLERKLVDGIY